MGTDTRFYRRLGPFSAGHIARRLNARLAGDGDAIVDDVAAPASAGAGRLVFFTGDPAALADLPAGTVAIIRADGLDKARPPDGGALIGHDAPKAAFAQITASLIAPYDHEGEALVSPEAEIHSSAKLAPGCIIGPGAVIGEHCVIGAGAVIGPGCVIGEKTRIGPRAAVNFALIGAACEIGAGAVIGETGFGLSQQDGALITLPHVGRVVIEDDVTIGANATLDRGMLSDTVLGRGCRIDNLSHIGHNVVLGEQVVMAAFAGLSGSVTVGAGAQFGGRVGVADHLNIGAGARLAADSAVMRDVPAGETWAGSPAQPIQRFMREIAWLRRASARKAKSDKS